jgi:hypothetical protein
MADIKIQVPAVFEMKIYCTNDDGQDGVITYTLPVGKVPTLEDARDAIEKSIEQVGNGFRALDKREFLEQLAYEKTGQNRAVASGREFDDEA